MDSKVAGTSAAKKHGGFNNAHLKLTVYSNIVSYFF